MMAKLLYLPDTAEPFSHHDPPQTVLTLPLSKMPHDIWAIPLQLTNFNLVVAVLGGFISLFGLVSYLLKENYYLSEARTSLGMRLADLEQPLTFWYSSHRALGGRRFWTKWCQFHSSRRLRAVLASWCGRERLLR